MNPWVYLLLLAALVVVWLVAESGYEGYESETAFGETTGGIVTIEFVAMIGRIVAAAFVLGMVIGGFTTYGWRTGLVATVIAVVGGAVYWRPAL